MDYRYSRTITNEERTLERTSLLAHGNHKSANGEPDQIDRLLKKEVHHGFAIPVPIDVVAKIKQSSVQPLGLAKQLGLSSDGTRKIKYRMTQDLSYSHTRTANDLPVSVNSRIDMNAYPEIIFGWCLLRIIHLIVSLRLHYPHSRILISKYDYSDAYRRMAHSIYSRHTRSTCRSPKTLQRSLHRSQTVCKQPKNLFQASIVTSLLLQHSRTRYWTPPLSPACAALTTIIASLCSTDRYLTLYLVDRLLPQAFVTLYLLQARAQLSGTFDLYRAPIAPPKTACGTCATQAVDGWYLEH
jgi:hypothetical protein